jgi:hypothetical protein
MLASALAGDDLQELFPLLGPLAPQMVTVIQAEPRRLGPLGDGQRLLVPPQARTATVVSSCWRYACDPTG